MGAQIFNFASKIFTLPRNFPNICTDFCIFGRQFSNKKIFHDGFPTVKNLGWAVVSPSPVYPAPAATPTGDRDGTFWVSITITEQWLVANSIDVKNVPERIWKMMLKT